MYQGYSLTQESIAEELGVSEGTINNILKNSTHGKIEENFKPYIYNIWKQLKGNEKANITECTGAKCNKDFQTFLVKNA